jgi:hypothetical protein
MSSEKGEERKRGERRWCLSSLRGRSSELYFLWRIWWETRERFEKPRSRWKKCFAHTLVPHWTAEKPLSPEHDPLSQRSCVDRSRASGWPRSRWLRVMSWAHLHGQRTSGQTLPTMVWPFKSHPGIRHIHAGRWKCHHSLQKKLCRIRGKQRKFGCILRS